MCSIYKEETGRCEKFQIRENPKLYKSANILCHGLLKCKTCCGVWNRDVSVPQIYIELQKLQLMDKSDLNIYIGKRMI